MRNLFPGEDLQATTTESMPNYVNPVTGASAPEDEEKKSRVEKAIHVDKLIHVKGEKMYAENVMRKFHEHKTFLEFAGKKNITNATALDDLLDKKVRDMPNVISKNFHSPNFDPNNSEHYPHFMGNWSCIHDVIEKANEHGQSCVGELEHCVSSTFSPGYTNKLCKYSCNICT